jgi:hypothetical protein
MTISTNGLPTALAPLVALSHWVLWRWETTKKGKLTKVPYQAARPRSKADSTDPATWSDFATAAAAAASADGIGFCLLNSNYGAFDIDDCRDATTGAIDPWAMALVARAGSYTEITVSGTGLRIIGRATGTKIHRKQAAQNGITVETYRKAERYIVMTGNMLPGAPAELADLDAVMDAVVTELGAREVPPVRRRSGNGAYNPNVEPIAHDDPRLSRLDQKWLALGYDGAGIAEKYGGHRSRAVMAFACECFRADIAEDVIVSCLMHWKIGEHVRDQNNVERALARVMERSRQFVENSKLYEMNQLHCVLPIGGKTRVATWGDDPDFPGRETIVMVSTFDDFAALYNKYRHSFPGKDKKGNPITITMGLGSWWLSQPGRSQYNGGWRFMPNRDEDVVNETLNLWQGFAVTARKPEGKSGAQGCNLFLDHGLKVICSDNTEHFDYLMKREALIAQKRMRSEIAVGLATEEEGTGKGFWCDALRRLYGVHAMQVQNPEHVTGKHNAHLEQLLRLTADEAIFAGDPRQRNALYNLITEPRLTIEPKFIGTYTAPNYLNIDVISNAKHFLLVGANARRFFVPTVSSERAGDHAYFHRITAQLHDGGYEALLYHLLFEIDVRDFNVRAVPKTAALLDQKLFSLSPEQAWWFDTLMRGELPWGCTETNKCPSPRLFNRYIHHAQRQGAKRRSIETQLGMFLNKAVPGLTKAEGQYVDFSNQKRRGSIYTFPPLADCRKAFADAQQQTITWSDPAAWIQEPSMTRDSDERPF